MKLLKKIAWLLLIPTLSWATTPVTKTIDKIGATGGSSLSVPSTGTTLSSDTNTLTLTNKTISGGSNTLSELPVATQITQVVVTPYPNSSTTAFTLSPTPPSNGSGVTCNIDGILMRQGASYDYTVSGSTLTLNTAPATGQNIYCVYSEY